MISKNIKELRLERGLSQAELAKKIGVTQGAVYFWEKGISEPTAGFVKKLAEFFEISTDDLLSHNTKRVSATTKEAEMAKLFSRLQISQQNLLIDVAKELLTK
jgi:transcriptional regulator with XRE-family HTH domain